MRRLAILLALFFTFSSGHAQDREKESMDALCNRVFDLARVQAVYMDSLLTAMEMADQAGHDVMAGPDRPSLYPRTFQGDTLVTSGIDWWCSGFYPGVLWRLFFGTGEQTCWELAIKYTVPLAGLLDRETDHDIGFQLMSSFGPLQDFFRMSDLSRYSSVLSSRVQAPDPSEVDDILSRGAAKLAARFVPEAGVIRSWNWGPWNIPVIIDNMMNLELLDAAGYWEITEKHALTTLKNHFREDGTVWHLVDYADDGTVLGKQTVQGYADDTAWARGQAWALYGYARMAESRAHWAEPEVHFQPFHDAAAKLEAWLLENLPEATTLPPNWKPGCWRISLKTESPIGTSRRRTIRTRRPEPSSPAGCSRCGACGAARMTIPPLPWPNASSAPSPPPNTWPNPAPTEVFS